MSEMIAWIAAEAERPKEEKGAPVSSAPGPSAEELAGIPAHAFGANERSVASKAGSDHVSEIPHPVAENATRVGPPQSVEHPPTVEHIQADETEPCAQAAADAWDRHDSGEDERQRRIYRGRTVGMLRRYLRYAMECGRVPSLLGAEFFRARVTAYTVVTFEDRVIFVHDMERCLEHLDEFSRQLIARHVLQDHDQAATSRLLNCSERTVRTYVPVALDLLSEILLEKGLMERLDSDSKKSCQGGLNDENFVSDCEYGKNNF